MEQPLSVAQTPIIVEYLRVIATVILNAQGISDVEQTIALIPCPLPMVMIAALILCQVCCL